MRLQPLNLSGIYRRDGPTEPIKKIDYKGTIVERLEGEEADRAKQGLESLTFLQRDGFLRRFIDTFYGAIDPSTLVGFIVTSSLGSEYYLVAKSKETLDGNQYELVLKGLSTTTKSTGPSVSSLDLTRHEIQLGISLGTNYTNYQLLLPIEPNPPRWVTWAPEFISNLFRPSLSLGQLFPLHSAKYGASFGLGKYGPLSQKSEEDPKCGLIANRLYSQIQKAS